jgi:hypothetical protein
VSKLLSKTSAQTFLSTVAFVLLTGFGSCSPHIDEACRKQIPEFQKKLETARLEIKTDYVRPEGRALASLKESSVKEPTVEEIKQWQFWAEDRLKEVQEYMDIVHAEAKVNKVNRSVQAELAHAANDLVTFDGFAEKKKTRFMVQALESAQKHSDIAARLACSSQ